jgi:uracil-DNA glycosylase
MDVKIGNKWDEVLAAEFNKPYFTGLFKFLSEEYASRNIYPKKENIFNAFKYTDFDEVKVVIFGQDPYHGAGQAHGLAFSVQAGARVPPSLRNIYKELADGLGCYVPNNGCLRKWAKQGVLLLNTVLTVREGEPNSHKNKGWEIFTEYVTKVLTERERPVVFLLWGANALVYRKYINPPHAVMAAPHPSPLSARRGFFGCGHFNGCNDILTEIWKTKNARIDWQIENIKES